MPVELNDRMATTAAGVLGRCAELVLELLGRSDYELDVSIVGDDEMRELNHSYRGKDRPTDVLSFPQLDDEQPQEIDGGDRLLGDVVISLDTAARQAQAGGWTLEEELNRLLLHGVLHLLGYDHEASPAEEARMQAEESRLAAALRDGGMPCAADEGA